MSPYLHEQADWRGFFFDRAALAESLAAVRHRQGHLLGRMEALGFEPRLEAAVHTLTQDVVKTSEI